MSLLDCQGLCYGNEDCVAFTHHNAGNMMNFCYLFSETSSPVDCNYECFSGPRECDLCSEQFTCSLSQDDFLAFYPNIPTETYCQYFCYALPECSRYTWYSEDDPIFSKDCYLLKSCDEPMSCEHCSTGPDDCAKCFTLPGVPNGRWDCPFNDLCFLQCDPGFVAVGESQNYCNEGNWLVPLESFSCGVGVALLNGGYQRSTTEVYSTNLTCTKTFPEHLHKTSGHSMEYIGLPMMCGGIIDDDMLDVSNKCWVMDDDEDGDHRWKEYDFSTRESRAFGSSIEYRGTVWLLGGTTNSTSTEFLSPRIEWNAGLELNHPLIGGCAVRLSGDSFFMTVSGESHDKARVSHVTKYFNDGHSEELASLRTPRTGHACTLVNTNTFSGVLVCGGYTIQNGEDFDILSTCELYDFESEEWHGTGSLNIGRSGFELLPLDGGILALGGAVSLLPNGEFEISTSVEKFNLSTRQWDLVRNITEPRASFAATIVPADLFC